MILFSLTLACAPDIRDTDNDGDLDVADSGLGDSGEADADTDSDGDADTDTDTDTDSDTAADPGRVSSTPEGSTGVTYVEVESTSETEWIYLDFAMSGEATSTGGWEIAFSRYNVMTNGGTSGIAGVEVAPVEGAGLEEVTSVPGGGWREDAGEDYALGDWYDYDGATHVLTAVDRTYVIKNGAGEAWKLRFVDYYDDAGNSGYPSFRWAAL